MTKEEVIKRLEEYKDMLERAMECECSSFTMAIESLQTENEWIPCSERLPKVGQDVLFCDGEWTGEGYMREDGDWFQFRWSAFWRKEEVIAWMPLPKPYGESEVKE